MCKWTSCSCLLASEIKYIQTNAYRKQDKRILFNINGLCPLIIDRNIMNYTSEICWHTVGTKPYTVGRDSSDSESRFVVYLWVSMCQYGCSTQGLDTWWDTYHGVHAQGFYWKWSDSNGKLLQLPRWTVI